MQLSYPPLLQRKDRILNHLVRAVLVLACLLLTRSARAAPPPKKPDFDAVTKVVRSHFASNPGYQDGDLISRPDIGAVLKSVADAGWKVHNASQIVELGLPDGSFLIRELHKPGGQKFMRKVARFPGGYPHLDRLSTIPRGEKTIQDLIRQPNGDKFIEYMATTKGGHNLGKMMGNVRNGVDLNKPTGRIYTATDLLVVLQRIYTTTP